MAVQEEDESKYEGLCFRYKLPPAWCSLPCGTDAADAAMTGVLMTMSVLQRPALMRASTCCTFEQSRRRWLLNTKWLPSDPSLRTARWAKQGKQ